MTSLFLHHLDENSIDKVIRDIARILKPGGLFIIEDYFPHGSVYDVLKPLHDEAPGMELSIETPKKLCPTLSMTLQSYEEYDVPYTVGSAEDVIKDILECNPQYNDIPDLAEKS
jgi:SAM-dependent methyltransferase